MDTRDRSAPGRAVRVAIDATPLLGSPTGVGRAVQGLVGGLAGRPGVRLTGYGLTARGHRDLPARLPPGVAAVRRPMPAGVLLRLWARADRPRAEWWTGRVDLVHGTNFVVPPARAARLVTVHDLTPVLFPELCTPTSRRYPHLIGRALAGGAHVHAVSRTVAGEVMEHFGVGPDRVHVVHNGLDGPPAGPGSGAGLPGSGHPVPAGPPYVLGLGTVEPRKNFPRLVAAFDAVADRLADLELRIAGPAGWGEDDLRRAVSGARHRDRIHRLGWVADPTALLSGARVFAFPSLYEGFGFPPLEAMALGVPVVAGAAGSVPEVLGDAALLVDPLDVDALADALLEAIEAGPVRDRLVAAGPPRAGLYSWARAADGMEALYRALT